MFVHACTRVCPHAGALPRLGCVRARILVSSACEHARGNACIRVRIRVRKSVQACARARPSASARQLPDSDRPARQCRGPGPHAACEASRRLFLRRACVRVRARACACMTRADVCRSCVRALGRMAAARQPSTEAALLHTSNSIKLRAPLSFICKGMPPPSTVAIRTVRIRYQRREDAPGPTRSFLSPPTRFPSVPHPPLTRFRQSHASPLQICAKPLSLPHTLIS